MANSIPEPPKTQAELDEWIAELESPTDQSTREGVLFASKKATFLKGVKDLQAKNLLPQVFWITLAHLWKSFNK